ncbi:MAG TPA: protein kinase [Steroidobacteraceae bacterium]|nr:protein kinase [Steroidobacteraceae bacterium]
MQVADQRTADGLHVGLGQASRQGGRAENQDYAACYVGTPRNQLTIGLLAALSDGMGGAKGGRVAAELAVRGFIDGCLGQPATIGISRIGARAADAVNRWIHTLGRSDPSLNGMACTLSALVLCGRSTHLVHVGDSRVYRLRDNMLTLLTTDHTLGAPGTTHALTRAVGAQDSLRVDHFKENAQLHDRYLLCSDGVHGALSQTEIHALLALRSAPGETAERLVDQATVSTDSDNATAVVLDILALPSTQFADMELAISEQPLRSAPVSGAVIDGYELGEMLADGQYMRVFRARDQNAKREVVLKFPKPRPGLDALLRAALLREMWIASHVRSPFVTESLEPPTERRSCLYGVLPYYAGETLERRLIRRPRITLAAGLEIALKLTKAVAALHRAGIIHRDIKPENIMLESDGGLKLIDLGVARLRRFDEGESLEVPGTRSYMAPELFAGMPADESSDIFALGVTLYRMFTAGSYPYGEVEAFAQPRLGKATALAKLRPDLPAWLDRTIARAITIDRRDRYADAIEFGFELEHGSLRATPHAIERPSLYDRNPARFWQVVSALLFVALMVALAHLR